MAKKKSERSEVKTAGRSAGDGDPKNPPAVHLIPIDQIEDCPWNTRRVFSPEDEVELAESIKQSGLISPITVRPLKAGPKPFQLLAGERRLGACKLAGMESIQCVVRDLSDDEAHVLTVSENMHRRDLTPIEEAAGIEQMTAFGWNYEMIASQLGKSVGWVAKRARLTQLSERWKKEVAVASSLFRAWPAGYFEELAKVAHATQDELLNFYSQNPWRVPSMTREELRERIEAEIQTLGSAPWKLDNAALLPEAGACTECPKRASQEPFLFDLEGTAKIEKDRCLDKTCWAAKLEKYLTYREVDLRAKHGDGLVVAHEWKTDKVPADSVSYYSREPAKKNEPGAQPTLIVNGPSAGKVCWTKDGGYGPKKAERPRGADGKALPKPIDAKRAELQARRQAVAISHFMDAVDETRVAPPALTTGVALRLAVLFGTGPSANARLAVDGMNFEFERLAEADNVTPYDELWELVKDKVQAWLTCQLAPATHVGEFAEYWKRVEWLAPLVGLDAAEYFAAAVKELPEPKGWAKEGSEVGGQRPGKKPKGPVKGKRSLTDGKTAAAGK